MNYGTSGSNINSSSDHHDVMTLILITIARRFLSDIGGRIHFSQWHKDNKETSFLFQRVSVSVLLIRFRKWLRTKPNFDIGIYNNNNKNWKYIPSVHSLSSAVTCVLFLSLVAKSSGRKRTALGKTTRVTVSIRVNILHSVASSHSADIFTCIWIMAHRGSNKPGAIGYAHRDATALVRPSLRLIQRSPTLLCYVTVFCISKLHLDSWQKNREFTGLWTDSDLIDNTSVSLLCQFTLYV